MLLRSSLYECSLLGALGPDIDSFLSGLNQAKKLEARVGIEPTYKGFADLSLTTWVPRPIASWEQPRGRGLLRGKFGAGDGGRTRDIDLGKVALYH